MVFGSVAKGEVPTAKRLQVRKAGIDRRDEGDVPDDVRTRLASTDAAPLLDREARMAEPIRYRSTIEGVSAVARDAWHPFRAGCRKPGVLSIMIVKLFSVIGVKSFLKKTLSLSPRRIPAAGGSGTDTNVARASPVTPGTLDPNRPSGIGPGRHPADRSSWYPSPGGRADGRASACAVRVSGRNGRK
jgi:hypothetical protein